MIPNFTLKQVVDGIRARLPSRLPASFNDALAAATGGFYILLHKYGNFLVQQVFVKFAIDEDIEINGQVLNPLREWGRLVGISEPAPATQTEATLTVTVTNQTGSLAEGTQLVKGDIVYLSTSSVLLNASTVAVPVRSALAGAATSLEVADVVSFPSPVPNVATDAVVASVAIQGANRETTAAYRIRILDRFQKRPKGGAYADFEQWGELPASIINAYPYTGTIPGTVDVYVEAVGGAIPTAPQIAEAQAAIDAVRPILAPTTVLPISRTSFDVAVAGLSVPSDLAEAQNEITSAIEAQFLAFEPFIPGLSVPPREDRITNVTVSGLVDRIVRAREGSFAGVTLSLTGNVFSLYTLGRGEKAQATVTF